MRRFLLGTVLAMVLAPGWLWAQDTFPSRPVRIVVPYPPGGPPDFMSRLLSPRLSDLWGKPVVVENRAGATGSIGTDSVAKAAPDGYTLLMTPSQPMVMAPALLKVAYDSRKDFTPIGIFGDDVNMLIVNSSLGVKSLAELVQLARSKPGALNHSSAGIGSLGHLCLEMVKQSYGISMTHVPYNGAIAAMNATIAGEVAMSCGPVQAEAPHVRAGKLVAIGIASTRKSRVMPDVPLLSTPDHPGLVVSNWYGVFATAGIPKVVHQTLRDSFQKVILQPDIRAKLEATGMELYWQDAEQVLKIIDADLLKWRQVVQAANIRLE